MFFPNTYEPVAMYLAEDAIVVVKVRVRLVNGAKTTLLRLGPHLVSPGPALLAALKAVLGPSAVSL